MLRAVSLLEVVFVLPFDAEHPCNSNAAKKAKPTANNNVLRLMSIINPYRVYDCSSREGKQSVL